MTKMMNSAVVDKAVESRKFRDSHPFHNNGLVTVDTVGQTRRRSTIKALDRLYLDGSRIHNSTWILTSLEKGLNKLLSYQVDRKRVVVSRETGVQNFVHLVDKGLCYGWQERVRKDGDLEKIYIVPACSIAYTVKQEIDQSTGRYLFAVYCRHIGSDNTPAWMSAGSIYGETFEADARHLNEMVCRLCAMENLEPLD